MKQNRLFVLVTWSALLIGLLIYPGTNCRFLFSGNVVGYWPFALLGERGDVATLLTTFALSAGEVAICAWVMDRARLTRKVWGVCPPILIAGAITIGTLHDYDFEAWKLSPSVCAAMASPELHYEPTRGDFNRAIAIPRILAGGMWGLYAATALCAVYSAATILLRNRRPKRSTPAAAISRHEC